MQNRSNGNSEIGKGMKNGRDNGMIECTESGSRVDANAEAGQRKLTALVSLVAKTTALSLSLFYNHHPTPLRILVTVAM
jgi:hypothetical protein